MRIILSFILAAVLTGCAGTMDALNPKPIRPNVGDSFNAVNKMSNDAGTGDLVDISASLDLSERRTYTGTPMDVYGARKKDPKYDPYKFYRAFQRNFIDHSILQPYTPKSDIFVFRQDKLVLISADGTSLANDMQSLIEDDKRRAYYGADFDLANKIHADYGAWATKEDMANLHALKVNDLSELDAAEAELRNYKELYRSADAGDLFRYLVDRAVSNSKHITIAQAAQIRKAEEEKAAKFAAQEAERQRVKAEAQAAKERAEHAKEYPFEAVLTCTPSYNDRFPATFCFSVGDNHGHMTKTELELTNGKEYHMYSGVDVRLAGQQTDEGLIIPLRNHFELIAQNANDNGLLSVVIRDTKTHKVVFQKSASKYGVVKVRN